MRGTGVRQAGKPVSDKNQQMIDSPTWMTPSSPPSLKTSFAYKKGDREDSQRRNKAKDKRRKKLKRECGKGNSGQGGLGCMHLSISPHSNTKLKIVHGKEITLNQGSALKG